jgi:hypothetical protein
MFLKRLSQSSFFIYFLIFIGIGTTLLPQSSSAQFVLKGKVFDSENGKPLPFVNIIYSDKGHGLSTTLNGTFEIATSTPVSFVQTSYLGYAPKRVEITMESYKKNLIISLSPLAYSIEAIIVKPGINPAHRIIDSAIANRERNNPENLKSFRYRSYNKMTFESEFDSVLFKAQNAKHLPDSLLKIQVKNAKLRFEKKKQDVPTIIMETVSERFYKKPGENNETVLATRMTGYSEPYAILLATQLQSFSFYSEHFTLFQKTFLNPINRRSRNNYLFILESKYTTPDHDTIFIISFKPLKNKYFDGLKGTLYINSNGFAVQNVLAEPTSPIDMMFDASIQQRYERIEGKYWFPVELNLNLKIYTQRAGLPGSASAVGPSYLVGNGQTTISGIEVNPKVDTIRFNHIELAMHPLMYKRDEEFWNTYRSDSLTAKEIRSYEKLDSIGRAAKLDMISKTLSAAITGKLDLGYIAVDVGKTLSYNRFEGYRLGLGLQSGSKISKRFTLGGFYGYGTSDEKSKYGSFAQVMVNPRQQFVLEAKHQLDVREPGSNSFEEKRSLGNPDLFFSIFNPKRDYVTSSTISLGLRSLKYLYSTFYFSNSSFSLASGFQYVPELGDTLNAFGNTEVGIKVSLVLNEKFADSPWGILPINYGSPMIWVNYSQGIKLLKGEFEYHRIEARLRHRIDSPKYGRTQFVGVGGLITGNVPVSLLFIGRGNAFDQFIDGSESFNTMPNYKFVSDRYINIFLSHQFRPLFKKLHGKKFNPQINLVQKISFGNYTPRTIHGNAGTSLISLNKGYFETSFQINNILKSPLGGYGIGTSYVLGPYSSKSWRSNVAVVLTYSFFL